MHRHAGEFGSDGTKFRGYGFARFLRFLDLQRFLVEKPNAMPFGFVPERLGQSRARFIHDGTYTNLKPDRTAT